MDLADTKVADYDIIDFLHILNDRSVQLLPASAVGVLLAGPHGELRAVAASSEAAGLLGLFQIQNDQGPCLDCVRTGRPVTADGLQGPGQRWPRFAAAVSGHAQGVCPNQPELIEDGELIASALVANVVRRAHDR